MNKPHNAFLPPHEREVLQVYHVEGIAPAERPGLRADAASRPVLRGIAFGLVLSVPLWAAGFLLYRMIAG